MLVQPFVVGGNARVTRKKEARFMHTWFEVRTRYNIAPCNAFVAKDPDQIEAIRLCCKQVVITIRFREPMVIVVTL